MNLEADKMKAIAILALATLGSPMAAWAGGPATPTMEPQVAAPVVAAPVAAVGPWTGPYGGLSLGYGNVTSGSAGLSGKGGFGGVYLGYRHEFGQMVVGGELSYDANNIKLGTGNSLDNTTNLQLQLGRDMGNTLAYVAAGVDRSNATLSGASASGHGYFGGIGADYMLGNRWTVGGEILAHRYNDFANSGISLNDTTLQVKVGLRF